jgi:hypothetical protein
MNRINCLFEAGYSSVCGLQLMEGSEPIMGPLLSLSQPVLVAVTSGKSCIDISKGLSINQNESFLKFYNRYIMARRPQRSELKLHTELDGITVTDTLMNEGQKIRLCRTLRIPEDGRAHDVPSTFGPFPMINISKCLPENTPPLMKKKGGFLIPMLQREAMCVTTSGLPRAPRKATQCLFAVKLYAGGVNAITGYKSIEKQQEEQDYYVLPLQQRVDGFGANGTQNAKQFVAMPLGTKYSVEHQLTGNEYGGIQLEIAPRLKTCVEFRDLGNGVVKPDVKHTLTKTPKELGLESGHLVRMTEEKGVIGQPPWTWTSNSEDRDETELDDWSYFIGVDCNRPVTSSVCSVCRNANISSLLKPTDTRPTSLLDLLNMANYQPLGALVLTAHRPLSIILEHSERNGRAGAAGVLVQVFVSTSIHVSPFERTKVFEARIKHTVAKWYETQTTSTENVSICNAEWLAYERRNPGSIPIAAIGISDGYIVKTIGYPNMPKGDKHYAYGFYDRDDAVETTKPKGWEMALASGGEVRQRVKRDPIPEYWNWDATHFINIQILNTIAFESITGLAAPSSPISFEEYTKAGIPSLSYYLETDDRASPNFPVIKSVGEVDSSLSIKQAARLGREGKPVGCIVCEKNLCDAM